MLTVGNASSLTLPVVFFCCVFVCVSDVLEPAAGELRPLAGTVFLCHTSLFELRRLVCVALGNVPEIMLISSTKHNVSLSEDCTLSACLCWSSVVSVLWCVFVPLPVEWALGMF